MSGKFKELPDRIPYKYIYDRMDAGVTGICIDLTLEEAEGLCLSPYVDYEKKLYPSSFDDSFDQTFGEEE